MIHEGAWYRLYVSGSTDIESLYNPWGITISNCTPAPGVPVSRMVNPPADKQPVQRVMVYIVVGNGCKRRTRSGMKPVISTARNLAVFNGYILGYLPADSFAVKIFYMHIVNRYFF